MTKISCSSCWGFPSPDVEEFSIPNKDAIRMGLLAILGRYEAIRNNNSLEYNSN